MGTKQHTDTEPPPPAAIRREPRRCRDDERHRHHDPDGLVWRSARIHGVVTTAIRDGDHAALVEYASPGVWRIREYRRTPGGWQLVSDLQHDNLRDVDPLEVFEAAVPFLSEAA